MSKPATQPSGVDRLLAFTWVGHLPLALAGESIVEIDSVSDESAGAVDVFTLLGVACALSANERRVARISHGDARWLLLGDRVELGTVGSDALLPPPSFLSGLCAGAGLLGFVFRAGTLFSLFDPVPFANAFKKHAQAAPTELHTDDD